MAVDDIYELVLGMSLNGEKLINRFECRQVEDADSYGPNAALKEQFVGVVLPKYKLATTADLLFTSIRTRKIFPTAGGTILFTLTDTGAIAQDPLPPNATALISLYTQYPRRQGRGRKWISGISETNVSDGSMNVAQFDLLVDLAFTLTTEWDVGGGVPKYESVAFDPEEPSWHRWFKWEVRTRLHSLRSRTKVEP